jgi:hypothetical protein
MKYTPIGTQKRIWHWLGSRLHTLVVVSVVLAAVLGRVTESHLGWVACPPRVMGWSAKGKRGNECRVQMHVQVDVQAGWEHLGHTWVRALARSTLLAVLVVVSDGGWGSSWRVWGWVPMLPWVEWLLEGGMVAWPWLGQQPEMRGVRWGSLLLCSVQFIGQ